MVAAAKRLTPAELRAQSRRFSLAALALRAVQLGHLSHGGTLAEADRERQAGYALAGRLTLREAERRERANARLL